MVTVMKIRSLPFVALFFSLALCGVPSLAFSSSAADSDLAWAINQFSVCENNECESVMRQFNRLSRGGSGDASALVAVGFANGEGFERDKQEAERYIKLGVRQGSGLAAYIL